METRKLTKDTIIDGAAVTSGALAGAMLSRIIADKIPSKDDKSKKIKLAALTIAGIVGAALLNNRSTTGAALQGAAVGFATTQANELVKSLTNPQEGLMKTALGTPCGMYSINESYDPYIEYDFTENMGAPQYVDYLAPAEEEKFSLV